MDHLIDVLDTFEYGNSSLNGLVENFLIGLLKSPGKIDPKELSDWYKSVRGIGGFGKSDCHYEYILDDLPFFEKELIEYIIKY